MVEVIEETRIGLEVICTGAGNSKVGCGRRLFVERKDIYETSSVDMVGDKDFYNTFRCPACGAETDISNQVLRELDVEISRLNSAPKVLKKVRDRYEEQSVLHSRCSNIWY